MTSTNLPLSKCFLNELKQKVEQKVNIIRQKYTLFHCKCKMLPLRLKLKISLDYFLCASCKFRPQLHLDHQRLKFNQFSVDHSGRMVRTVKLRKSGFATTLRKQPEKSTSLCGLLVAQGVLWFNSINPCRIFRTAKLRKRPHKLQRNLWNLDTCWRRSAHLCAETFGFKLRAVDRLLAAYAPRAV